MSVTVHTAAQNKQLNVLRSLVSEDPALVNSVDVNASALGRFLRALDIARFLIDRKAEVDRSDNSGWTPLHIAVSAGHTEIVQELIGAGADVNRQVPTTDKGTTPLHYAASKTRIDIGRLLLSRGANFNARDKANQLPL
ncbi:ankyrin [Coprinellus micaceus]|uniref:Ankyrin n=1 Tax=Coprinellus micaceus TaxID=71717 RepID=A0A4Y7SCA8_COPMI|nr:ankyrin [Coprinellus micaceus]